jgi:GntR family L-lactate dehydrogenase operon transcriptional regulator
MDENDLIVLCVLTYLEEQGEPAGAGAVRRGLVERGHTPAEATVGRLLRELDDRGWTERRGNQGRVITAEGRERRAELDQEQRRNESAREFLDTLVSSEKGQILDLLVARRAVEREVARLAAVNADEEDLADLRRSVQQQEILVRSGGSVAEEDTSFHRILARGAKNRVLMAAMELFRANAHYAEELERIRRRVGRLTNPDHRRIMEAVEQRDPDMAELAMRRHLDNVLADCERYWIEEGKPGS